MSAPTEVRWALPDRPDHPRYAALREELARLPPQTAEVLRRVVAEQDYWFFVAEITSFGSYVVDEDGHPRNGQLWIDDPQVFAICRKIQADIDRKARKAVYILPRFCFKTTLITQLSNLWKVCKWPQLTIAIVTHKVTQTGDSMFRGFTAEIADNPRYALHWPDIFTRDPSKLPEFTDTSITVKRKPGPREPTLSIHPASKLPTGTHFDDIDEDDLIVAESVAKPEHIRKAASVRAQITALGKSRTRRRIIGTVWAQNDPNDQEVRARDEGTHVLRGFILPDGMKWSKDLDTTNFIPVIHSREFWEQWRKDLGPYLFSCLIMADPIPRNEQAFDVSWRRFYPGSGGSRYSDRPSQWNGRTVSRHLLIDPAGTDRRVVNDDNDFWIWRVVDLIAPDVVKSVDLWRERCNFTTVLDLTFALVRYYRPRHVWCEEFGAQNVIDPMMTAMHDRSLVFSLKKLPDLKTSKRQRIENLQVAYSQGRILEPADGYGHGSGPKFIDILRMASGEELLRPSSLVVDQRDTAVQFFEDEFLAWTPNSRGFDDQLDSLAWFVQKGMKGRLSWPENVTQAEFDRDDVRAQLDKQLRQKALDSQLGARRQREAPSWLVL